MQRLRIGIAGLGGQGRKHFSNCLRIKNSEVVAVADNSKVALSRIRGRGISAYNNYQEMITKEKPDAVIISLPHYLHEDCVTVSSENGCDILIEKPLGRNMEEDKRMASRVESDKTKLMVGMSHRFIRSCQKLKEEIEAGTFGNIQFASALFFMGPFSSGRRVPEWMFDPEKMGGGALLDSGCHMIDLLLWFFGDIGSVSGHLESSLNLGYEDYAEVSLRFKNGVNALAVTSWRARIPAYRVEVVGESGRQVAFSKKYGIFDYGILKGMSSFLKESISERIKGRPFLPLGDDIYYRELEYFTRCILNDETPEPSVNDWLKVSEIIDSIYRQNSINVKPQLKNMRAHL